MKSIKLRGSDRKFPFDQVLIVSLSSALVLSVAMGIAEIDRDLVRAVWETLLLLAFGGASGLVLGRNSKSVLRNTLNVLTAQIGIVGFMMFVERGGFGFSFAADFGQVMISAPFAFLIAFSFSTLIAKRKLAI